LIKKRKQGRSISQTAVVEWNFLWTIEQFRLWAGSVFMQIKIAIDDYAGFIFFSFLFNNGMSSKLQKPKGSNRKATVLFLIMAALP